MKEREDGGLVKRGLGGWLVRIMWLGDGFRNGRGRKWVVVGCELEGECRYNTDGHILFVVLIEFDFLFIKILNPVSIGTIALE